MLPHTAGTRALLHRSLSRAARGVRAGPRGGNRNERVTIGALSMHTPGPWTVALDKFVMAPPNSQITRRTNQGAELCVARLGAYLTVADARLIAAAPELLAALHVAERALFGIHDAAVARDARETARAAIAKAT